MLKAMKADKLWILSVNPFERSAVLEKGLEQTRAEPNVPGEQEALQRHHSPYFSKMMLPLHVTDSMGHGPIALGTRFCRWAASQLLYVLCLIFLCRKDLAASHKSTAAEGMLKEKGVQLNSYSRLTNEFVYECWLISIALPSPWPFIALRKSISACAV